MNLKKSISEGIAGISYAMGALADELARNGKEASELIASMADTMQNTLSLNTEMGWITRTYCNEVSRQEAIKNFKSDVLYVQGTEGWNPIDEITIEEIMGENMPIGYRLCQKCWRLVKDDGVFRDSKVYCCEADEWVRT